MTGVENLFTFSPGVSKTRTASPSPSTVNRKGETTSMGAVRGTVSSTMVDITRPPRGSTRPARLRRRASRGRAPPCGGAIALGHPVGCSGTRLILTLLLEMRRRKVVHGLATLCVGGGQGASILLEAV